MLDSHGARLDDLCHRSDTSYRGADSLAGLTPGHCQAIVRGTIRAPSALTLAAYARVFGCSVGWLIAGEGDAPADDEVRAAVARARALPRESAVVVEVLHDASSAPTRGAA